jgi:hypothetical protein
VMPDLSVGHNNGVEIDEQRFNILTSFDVEHGVSVARTK